MKPKNFKHIAFSLFASILLLAALLLILNNAPQITRAASTDLFVSPTGSGSACTQVSPCALQTGLNQAAKYDAIYLAGGTYTGSGAAVITVTESITLYGGWDGSNTTPVTRDPDVYVTTINGEGVRRGVYISGTIYPALDGLVITNGNAYDLGGYSSYDAGGGIYVNQAQAVIRNCIIISNTVTDGIGGGVFLYTSNTRLENNRIISNTANWGGGVRVIWGSPLIRSNHFQANEAYYGGGIYLMWSISNVENNAFQANIASQGGAIYLSGDKSTIAGNQIEGNQGNYGAGIRVNGGTPVTITRNTILNNHAGIQGGGIFISYNNTKLYNNLIAYNETVENGAGIYIKGASPQLWHNTLAQNTGGDGSGIFVTNDVSTLSTAALTNTILVHQTVGITVTAGNTATLKATLWGSGLWANGTDWGGAGSISTGMINIWGNPAFVDPANNDFHLTAISAAKDAGVDAGVKTDIDFDPRPCGSAPDIGADEIASRIYLPLVMETH